MHFSSPNENDLLTSALVGNSAAFTALVEPHRKPLLVHCYRLSGSLDDAEDIVQDTFIRAWHKIDSFTGAGSFRNWLYVIASRLWIDEVRKRKKQVLLPLNGSPANPDMPLQPPTSSSTWLDPLPDAWLSGTDPSAEVSYEQRESVSLAFMVALQTLNARQRVVLILRTVFNWRADEVAETLGLSVASVNNLLYRARKNLEETPLTDKSIPKQNLDQFVHAWESGDIPALIDLLHENATFAMPPMGVWYAGRDSIQRALQNFVFMRGVAWKLVGVKVNGRSAFATYQQTENGPAYQAFGLILPNSSTEGGKLSEIIAFLSPKLVLRCGLPQTISL